MAAPQLSYIDPAIIIAESKLYLEGLLGKEILPAQPEMQIVLAVANREILVRSAQDYATSQNLVEFSTAPMLDYLAANSGVIRLGATPAETVIRFQMVPGHGGVIIPAGTRVATTDGKVMFATDIETAVGVGVNVVEVSATATADGLHGNNYGAGTVAVIIDVKPFLLSATNIIASAAGSELETDEGLRRRIKLAPSQFSTAGARNAYRFHAFSANPSIIDVAVTNPEGAHVNVFPLIGGGVDTPQAIIDAVMYAVNSDNVRPLNDIVTVLSPTKIEYELTVNIVLKYGATQSETLNRVTTAIDAYCTDKSKRLGEDITEAQLIAASMNPDVHSMDFNGFTAIVVNPTSFPVCTGIYIGSVSYENPNA